MKKIKLYLGIILIVLLVLFAFQNNDEVEVDFLFWSLEMSRIVLILGSMGIGIIAAWMISAFAFSSGNPK